jgi:alkylhydroperoxidase family enzyme
VTPDDRRIWIETVPEEAAEGVLAEIYASRRGRGAGRLGNRLKALSLWPELLAVREQMEQELARGSTLRLRQREMITVVAAALIGCHF